MAHSDDSLQSATPPSNRIRDAFRGTAFDGLDEDLGEVENSRSALRQVSLLDSFILNISLTYQTGYSEHSNRAGGKESGH